MIENLRIIGQIAALIPVVAAILLLRIFSPLVVALVGPEKAISWALSLKGQLDAQERSWH